MYVCVYVCACMCVCVCEHAIAKNKVTSGFQVASIVTHVLNSLRIL